MYCYVEGMGFAGFSGGRIVSVKNLGVNRYFSFIILFLCFFS